MSDREAMGVAAALRAIYVDRSSAARAWKRDGGIVVGYFCDNVPVELIHAAGCMPYRIAGLPDDDLSIVRDRIDALYPPDLTSRPAFVSSVLAQLLRGDLGFVDYLVVPHNRHAIQAVYRELQEAAAECPELKLPPLYYLDKAWSPLSDRDGFNRNAVLGLRDALVRWTGRNINDAAIATAIEQAEKAREALQRIGAARLERPTRLSGTSALHAYAAAVYQPPAEFCRLADALLDETGKLPERSGPRLFVGGSPLDHDRFYALVEELGATVVAEDHCWGARLADDYPTSGGAPIDQLAERFHHAPACSIRLSFDLTIAASVDRAVCAEVDGAIHFVCKGDGAQSWETPDEIAALRARGIPTLHLAEQSYNCTPRQELSDRIAAFLGSISADAATVR